jgi:hypothetical protein
MRTWIRSLSLYAFTALAAIIPLAGEDDGVTWLGDYKEALRAARQTGKPIFLEFRCEA